MNIILKDKYEYTTLNVNSGVTTKGDGGMYNVSLNSGSNIGGKGFINYTVISYNKIVQFALEKFIYRLKLLLSVAMPLLMQ